LIISQISLLSPLKSEIKHFMPLEIGKWLGLSREAMAQAFLTAPTPMLPRHRRFLFHNDLDMKADKDTFTEFVDQYHNIVNMIDKGYGPKTFLSSSAWLKTIADLTTHMLNGVLSTRADILKSRSPPDVKLPFNPEDQDIISQIQLNLVHLSNLFAITSDSPSWTCDHCLHRTDGNQAQDLLTEADYTAILMATDRSQTAMMDRVWTHINMNIHKEVNTWAQDKSTCRRNTLRLKIKEEEEQFYKIHSKQARETEVTRAKADSEEYYLKRREELKKDADAHLRQEMAAYCREARNTSQTRMASTGGSSVATEPSGGSTTDQIGSAPGARESTNTPLDKPHEHRPLPPAANSLPANEVMALLNCIADRVDVLELKLSTPSTHPTPPKKTTKETTKDPLCTPTPPSQPVAPAPSPPLNAWITVPPNGKSSGKKKNTKTTKLSGATTSTGPGPTDPPSHLEVTIIPKKEMQTGKEGRRDPLVITQQMCASLRAAGSPLTLLSG
jgi:hypothetical protein